MDTTVEIERIKAVLLTFGWTLIKQEVTEIDIVLTIKKAVDGVETEA